MQKQKMDQVEAEDFIFENSVNIEIAEEYGINFKDILFTDRFSYNGPYAISFKDCEFINTFSLSQYAPGSTIYIYDCIFNENILLDGVKTDSKIIFLNSIINTHLIISKSKIHELVLNNKYCKKIIIDEESSFSILTIGGKDENIIDSLHIHANIIDQRCTIDHVKMIKFYISYSTLSNELNIANCRFNSCTFEHFRNDGSLRLLNCSAFYTEGKVSTFAISKSNMGKAEFFNVNFTSFGKVNIIDSVLFEAIIIGSRWSKNIISQPTEKPELFPETKTEHAVRIREVYKQIKLALSKQGSFAEEQFFHGLEMNAYNQSLTWRSDGWTKIILTCSNYFGKYGQSMRNPIIVLIVLNGLLYSLLKYQLCYRLMPLYSITLKNAIDQFADYLRFMNPLRKEDPAFSGISLIIDLLIRIISSYCIYNLIRASRRFIK